MLYLQKETRRHSVERIPPPSHVELGTVSLPASSRYVTAAYIFPHCVITGFHLSHYAQFTPPDATDQLDSFVALLRRRAAWCEFGIS